MKIFSENPHLFKNIELGNIYTHQFPSGEWYCQFRENIRGEDVFLVADMTLSANESLMKLYVMADAARRASAKKITAVLPYFFYSRQDRKDKSRTPISAKLVMDLLEASGVNRIITMDLHNPAIQGFTNMACDNLTAEPLFYEWLTKRMSLFETEEGFGVDAKKHYVIASPDEGGIKRASPIAALIGLDFAYCIKKRLNDTDVIVQNVAGNVKEKIVVLYDDISESLSTLESATNALYNAGARNVLAFITHAPLTTTGLNRLSKSKMNFIFSTNTFYTNHPKVVQLDVSDLFYKAIKAVADNTSVSDLFKINGF